MLSKKVRQVILFFILIFFSLILSIFGFVRFQIRTSRIFNITGENYLTNITNLYSHILNIKFDNKLAILDAHAQFFEEVDLTNTEQIVNVIAKADSSGNFRNIILATEDGKYIDYNGNFINASGLRHHFKDIFLTGTARLSDTIVEDYDGELVLGFAAPVKQNGIVEGIIIGTIAYKDLNREFIDHETTDYYRNYIIDKEGSVIIGNTKTEDILKITSLISDPENNCTITAEQEKDIFEHIASNTRGIAHFEIDGKKNICIYSPLENKSWFIISLIRTSFLENQKSKITVTVLTLFITLLIAVAMIFYVIRQIYKKYKASKNDLERLSIANNQNNALVFSIDLKNNFVEFSGETKAFINYEVRKMNLKDFRELYKKIHPDDVSVVEHIRSIIEQKQKSYTTEFRFNINDEYQWFKFHISMIMDEKKNISSLICNFMNVNEQVTHELELKQIAETDMLSGLLNKGFYSKLVSQHIQKEEIKNGALFIIDLDNFKQINDTLGHSIGDHAIRDAAKKLTLVFSEKDFIGRIGGDEFSVFMCIDNSISSELASKIINDKARKVCDMLFEYYSNNNESVTISSSVGIALYPQCGNDFETLFERADSALYNVKQNGKNNFRLYSSDLTESGIGKYM